MDLCGETTIVTYRGSAVPEALTGTYIVIIAPHGVQPLWTHDGSLVPWQSGDLSSPVWGMPQLQKVMAHIDDGDPAEVYFWVVIHAETGMVLQMVVSSGGVG